MASSQPAVLRQPTVTFSPAALESAKSGTDVRHNPEPDISPASIAFNFLRYMHDSLRVSLGYIETLAKSLTFAHLPKLVQAFEGVALFVYLHSTQEEKALFPFINSRKDNFCSAFSSDHGKDLIQMAHIKQLLVELIKDKFNETKGTRVQKETLQWVHDHRCHLKLEEQYLKPILTGTTYSENEEQDLVRKMINVDFLAWKTFQLCYCFERLTDKARVDYITILQQCLPPAEYLQCREVLRPFFFGRRF